MKHTLIYLSQNNLPDKCKEILEGVQIFIYRAYGKMPSVVKQELEFLKKEKGEAAVFVVDNWRVAKDFELDGIYLEAKKENPLLVRDLLSPDQKIFVSVKNLLDLDFANTIEADGLVLNELRFEDEDLLEEQLEEVRMIKRFSDYPLYFGGSLTPQRLPKTWIEIGDGFVFEHYLEYDTVQRLKAIGETLKGNL